ncbi:MAG: hypothetical protein QOH26_1825 [Actinomycetota bacterium]|jgi:hypothetical protein|nr:hypothetical protein [Actinomycetota bacterium]
MQDKGVSGRRMTAVACVMTLAVAGVLAMAAEAAPATVNQHLKVKVHASINVHDISCTNTGTWIVIDGTLTFDGLGITATFQNNLKGTHTATAAGAATFEVTPAGGHLEVPKQGSQFGVGGNPHMSFQFWEEGQTSPSGGWMTHEPITDRIYLGRCVQGSTQHVEKDLYLDGDASAIAEGLDCTNRGSSIGLTGNEDTEDANGTLFLDNNKNFVVHESATAAHMDVDFGTGLHVRKGGNVNGAGGNPFIWLQFKNKHVGSDDTNASDQFYVGRCQELRKN